MSNRCEVPELSLFVSSIVQAERLGTSISNTLTIQADNMRERRRQSIKEEALKAPIKILFPLLLFIFPALFVVILVPVILNLIKQF
jgi:tight adherence protein C